jgi:hypothetical protein
MNKEQSQYWIRLLPYWHWSNSESNLAAPWGWHCFAETRNSHPVNKEAYNSVHFFVNLYIFYDAHSTSIKKGTGVFMQLTTSGGRFRSLPTDDQKVFLSKKSKNCGRKSSNFVAFHDRDPNCYTTSPRKPRCLSLFTLPSIAQLHGMLEPDNARCCHIDNQT